MNFYYHRITRRILTTFLGLTFLVGFIGCKPKVDKSKYEKVKQERNMLRGKVTSLNKENSDLKQEKEKCKNCLQNVKSTYRSTQPSTFNISTGESKISPCADVQVTISHLDTSRSWLYLKYTVNGSARWSDRLDYSKKDRGAFYIQDADSPVLFYVESCDSNSCTIQCRELPIKSFQCE